MLQREVGERILAQPGSKQYGRLSIMLQQSCAVEKILNVSSGAFSPPPKVESMVLRLTPFEHPPHQVDDPEAFEKIVRVAFSQRRKTLRNALMSLITDTAMSQLGIDPRLRPEQLNICDYVKLSQLL